MNLSVDTAPESAWFQPLHLSSDIGYPGFSKLAFKCNLYRYTSERAELAFDRANLMSGVTSLIGQAYVQAPGLTDAQRVRRREYAETRAEDDQTTQKASGKQVGQDAAGPKR